MYLKNDNVNKNKKKKLQKLYCKKLQEIQLCTDCKLLKNQRPYFRITINSYSRVSAATRRQRGGLGEEKRCNHRRHAHRSSFTLQDCLVVVVVAVVARARGKTWGDGRMQWIEHYKFQSVTSCTSATSRGSTGALYPDYRDVFW